MAAFLAIWVVAAVIVFALLVVLKKPRKTIPAGHVGLTPDRLYFEGEEVIDFKRLDLYELTPGLVRLDLPTTDSVLVSWQIQPTHFRQFLAIGGHEGVTEHVKNVLLAEPDAELDDYAENLGVRFQKKPKLQAVANENGIDDRIEAIKTRAGNILQLQEAMASLRTELAPMLEAHPDTKRRFDQMEADAINDVVEGMRRPR